MVELSKIDDAEPRRMCQRIGAADRFELFGNEPIWN
jgi:hypothetical protein